MIIKLELISSNPNDKTDKFLILISMFNINVDNDIHSIIFKKSLIINNCDTITY